MKLGSNLQFLRKLHGGMTQERLAERMKVSRQTVSKWETGEAIPDVEKLLELSRLFSCTLDALLKEDMAPQADYYSPVSIVTVPAFTLGRYVIISPQPEDDVQMYLDHWAKKSGLYDVQPDPRQIGIFPGRVGFYGKSGLFSVVDADDGFDDFDGAQIGLGCRLRSSDRGSVIIIFDDILP